MKEFSSLINYQLPNLLMKTFMRKRYNLLISILNRKRSIMIKEFGLRTRTIS